MFSQMNFRRNFWKNSQKHFLEELSRTIPGNFQGYFSNFLYEILWKFCRQYLLKLIQGIVHKQRSSIFHIAVSPLQSVFLYLIHSSSQRRILPSHSLKMVRHLWTFPKNLHANVPQKFPEVYVQKFLMEYRQKFLLRSFS